MSPEFDPSSFRGLGADRDPLSRIPILFAPQIRSDLTAAGECSAEGDLVGVLQVAPHRQPARQPGHGDAVAQPVGQIGGGRFAGHVRVGGEDDLRDLTVRDSSQQLADPQVLGLNSIEGRERAAEDVVEAAVLVCALERDDVHRLLDDAHDRSVAAAVEADGAQLLLGQVAAVAAEANALLYLRYRRCERVRFLSSG